MRDQHAQRRREFLRLRRPVGKQRSRGDDQARRAFVLRQSEDQRQGLQGLAEPHVVGQTRPEPEPDKEAEPAHARLLIGPQARLQLRPRQRGGERVRLAQRAQRLREPFARRDLRPVGAGWRVLRLDIGAGDQPHRTPERNALRARDPLDLGIAVERRLDPARIDLDPFAAQHREPVARQQQALQLLRRQRLAVERDIDGEIEHRARSDHRGRLGADGRGDRRPAWPRARPARRHTHDEAGRLQSRDIVEQTHRVGGRPAQRMEDLAAIDHLLQPAATFARPAHRLQQLQQIRPGARTGIFAQSRAERRMTQAAAGRHAGNIGREEGEGPLRVLAILGEIEMHAPDMAPAAVPRGEKTVELRPAFGQLRPEGFRHRPPQGRENLGAEIFAATHRRRGLGQS